MASSQPFIFPILSLPLDITLTLVSNHLDPVSALCLSLTCKPLHHAFFNTSRRRLTTRADKIAFLTLLETETPASVLCFACFKLHTCAGADTGAAGPVGVPASPLELGWDCKYSHAWMPAGCGAALGLSFRDARQAVLYAQVHADAGVSKSAGAGAGAGAQARKRGFAPCALDVCVDGGGARAAGVRLLSSSRCVAVVQGALMARCEHVFDVAGRSGAAAAAVEEAAAVGLGLGLGLCQHVELGGAAIREAAAAVGEVEAGKMAVRETREFVEGAVRRCGRCAMDYSVSFSGGAETQRMRVCSWHVFGSCATPFEKGWQDATARRRGSTGEVKDGDAEEAGLVRALWMTAREERS